LYRSNQAQKHYRNKDRDERIRKHPSTRSKFEWSGKMNFGGEEVECGKYDRSEWDGQDEWYEEERGGAGW
jgi:hypothetical protein